MELRLRQLRAAERKMPRERSRAWLSGGWLNWFLINASPDLRGNDQAAPACSRRTPRADSPIVLGAPHECGSLSCWADIAAGVESIPFACATMRCARHDGAACAFEALLGGFAESRWVEASRELTPSPGRWPPSVGRATSFRPEDRHASQNQHAREGHSCGPSQSAINARRLLLARMSRLRRSFSCSRNLMP